MCLNRHHHHNCSRHPHATQQVQSTSERCVKTCFHTSSIHRTSPTRPMLHLENMEKCFLRFGCCWHIFCALNHEGTKLKLRPRLYCQHCCFSRHFACKNSDENVTGKMRWKFAFPAEPLRVAWRATHFLQDYPTTYFCFCLCNRTITLATYIHVLCMRGTGLVKR